MKQKLFPLKRSFVGKTIHPNFTKEDESIYYLKEDIKSAVRWFRNERKKLIILYEKGEINHDQFLVMELDKLIEAFEVVMENEI